MSVRRSKNCPPWVDLWSWSCSTWGILECKHFQRILGTFKTLLTCTFMGAKTCKLFLKVLFPSNSKDSKCMTILSWKCSRKDLEDLNHLLTFILATTIQHGGLPSDFGGLSALTRLQLQYNYMVTLPKGFKELEALDYLEMHHCPNLVDVQGLPWSLEYLDLGDCPKLINIPSLKNLHSLKSLILCNCTSLTQLQDLDSLNTLKRVNLSSYTMLQNVPNLNHNGALEAIYL